jgi:V/A-type H+-transporting ATPase subunit I
MSIVALDKITLLGHMDDKERVLDDLQGFGCLHLIPLTPEGRATDHVGPSRDARDALHFLASATPRRRQITNPKNFDPDAVERQALVLQRRLYELRNRRDFLTTRIDNLAPWGDFEFPGPEQLGGLQLWFYRVPHHLLGEVDRSGLRWEITHTDQRFYYVVVVAAEEPEVMPVARVRTGGISRPMLEEELEEVESALEDVEAERLGLTRWCTLFARALDGLEDRADRAQASAQTARADPVFALQAWVPRHRMDALRDYAVANALALEVVPPDAAEQPPTLFSNPAPLRAGEDLVAFYMTPSYWLWDPSSLIFVSFALFFAMIVADAGYALLLAVIVLAYRRRLAASAAGRRWRTMLATLAGTTAVYGVLAGSYFGLSPTPGSLLDRLHVLELDNFPMMMALSVIIGALHVACACVMDGLRYPGWPQRLPSLGWALAVMGGLGVWGGMQLDHGALSRGGGGLLGLGLILVVGFAGYGEKPLVRAFKGAAALTGVSGAFGDVLSYLRLFALGLASASLAVAFNDMARDVRQAVPGPGVLFGLLILLFGHGLNFLLCVASGFIHGLRLNVIEFFKWGVKDEGNPFRPFERKESN